MAAVGRMILPVGREGGKGEGGRRGGRMSHSAD